MKHCICLCIVLFTIAATCCAQGLRRIFIEAGPQSSYFRHNANANLMVEFKITHRGSLPVFFELPDTVTKDKSKFNHRPPFIFAVGGGYEYFFDQNQLYDTRLVIQIAKWDYCYTYNSNGSYFQSSLFSSVHYKFNKVFDQQYICPEIGFSYNFTKGIGIVPSLNYYVPLVTNERWNRGFFLALKLRINIYVRYP